MPLPRFAKLPTAKQSAILEAARKEIAERGFAGASMNRIIAASGISKGAMYYYFADRDDLISAVFKDLGDRLEAAVSAEVASPKAQGDFWPSIERGLVVASKHLEADPQAVALGNAFHTGASIETIRKLQERVGEWIATLMVLGQELGAVRSDINTATLVAATTGLVTAIDRHVVLQEPRVTDHSQIARLISRLAQDLLVPRP